MSPIKSLEQVLSYQNDALVASFAQKKRLGLAESEALFVELKKWLWFLSQREDDSAPFAVFSEQSILDDYWHEFILSTKEYHAFCDAHFGRYIHHTPTLEGITVDGSGFGLSDALFLTDRKAFIAERQRILEASMREVAASLGVDTVVRWYRDLPRKYYYPTLQAEGK